MNYSIVLPIKAIDQGNLTNSFILFQYLGFPSYEKFLDSSGLDSFYIICPGEEITLITDLVKNSKLPYKIIDEKYFLDSSLGHRGWLKQQLIKLSISSIITTKYYLVLDADHYLNQKFNYEDIFSSGKIKYSSEPWQTENSIYYSTNSNWWKNSCKILNYDVEKLKDKNDLMGVTPQVLITTIVKSLIEYIKAPFLNLAKEGGFLSPLAWQFYLCDNNFTEFTLYWLYILMNSLENLYTPLGFPLWIHDLNTNVLNYNCSQVKIRNSFLNPTSYFSVIQGYIKQDLKPFIEEFQRHLGKHYDAIFITASMLRPNRPQAFEWYERLQQTTDTLNSIKKYIPNSFCILIEGTDIPEPVKEEYEKHYDHVLTLGKDSDILPYINHPHNIGHGEMKLLEHGIDYVLKNVLNKSSTKYIFKLGARYTLNDNFHLGSFSREKYSFKQRTDEHAGKVLITGLYSIPSTRLEEFRDILVRGQDILTSKCPMIEKLFLEMIPSSLISNVPVLGLEGMLSYNKEFFSV